MPRKSQAAVNLGRKGGLARGERLRAGEIPLSGAATPQPRYCARCGVLCESASLAKAHPKTEDCKPRKNAEQ
jgi:hypothetical protein